MSKICPAALAVALLVAAGSAQAASRLTVRGAGFGHGVGMSQYGAYGFAQNGFSYDEILAHYYTGTKLGSSGAKTVRVLLQGSVSRSSFSGARSASGRRLNPASTYSVAHGSRAGTVKLLSASGRPLKTFTGVLKVRSAGGGVRLSGVGIYRGRLEYRAAGVFGVQAVNAVGMEKYVRGVVARESPSSWPAEALKAQAVAARTYALTTSKGGNGFDQYPDTRSQVYGGVPAETASTNAATRATRREVVTYDGTPVVTYFFSTSGGRTENVENTSLGTEPLPWLKSVRDPYDSASPKHRWGPYRWSLDTAARKLSGLVRGSLKGIDVVRRGRSPRIVLADVVGSAGRTRVTGATLRARLGLYDTWAYFSSIRTRRAREPRSILGLAGVDPQARLASRAGRRLEGEVFPAVKGATVTLQRRERRGWRKVGAATTDSLGRYAYLADRPGRYRARYLIDAGPAVRLR